MNCAKCKTKPKIEGYKLCVDCTKEVEAAKAAKGPKKPKPEVTATKTAVVEVTKPQEEKQSKKAPEPAQMSQTTSKQPEASSKPAEVAKTKPVYKPEDQYKARKIVTVQKLVTESYEILEDSNSKIVTNVHQALGPNLVKMQIEDTGIKDCNLDRPIRFLKLQEALKGQIQDFITIGSSQAYELKKPLSNGNQIVYLNPYTDPVSKKEYFRIDAVYNSNLSYAEHGWDQKKMISCLLRGWKIFIFTEGSIKPLEVEMEVEPKLNINL